MIENLKKTFRLFNMVESDKKYKLENKFKATTTYMLNLSMKMLKGTLTITLTRIVMRNMVSSLPLFLFIRPYLFLNTNFSMTCNFCKESLGDIFNQMIT